MFMTKKQAQLLLLAAGVLMLLFGVWRGEADTVLKKSHPAVYGVCGHWIRKRKSFLPLPASGALYKPGLPC